MPTRPHEVASQQTSLDGLGSHIALVHILTPEFQLLDPEDFTDIHDEFLPYTHPNNLRASLLDIAPLKPDENHAVVGYKPYGQAWTRLTVTSREFSLFARHIPMLAETALQHVFNTRDEKLQKETSDNAIQARSNEDWAAARRAAMRQVGKRQVEMEKHLNAELLPRIATIHQFQEMSKYPNLSRGNQAIRERTERLRTYVFGDMFKAIGNIREWSNEQTILANRTLQKRLYMDPNKKRRVVNFEAMLQLADDYYGHKQAFVLSRIAEAKQYQRNRPEVAADIIATDLKRADAKRHV